jgi:uncharacterized membrane protein YqhA
MKWIIEQSRFLGIFISFAFLIAAIISIYWGITKIVKVAIVVIETNGQDAKIDALLIQVIDAFLLTIAFLVFAASAFELLIDKVNLPDWMIAHNFDELKTKLSGIIILVLAVKAVEKIIDSKNFQDLIYYALSSALIILSLVAFTFFNKRANSAKAKPTLDKKANHDH